MPRLERHAQLVGGEPVQAAIVVSPVGPGGEDLGFSRIASHRFYPQITIRNWNTTVRLHSMMELP